MTAIECGGCRNFKVKTGSEPTTDRQMAELMKAWGHHVGSNFEALIATMDDVVALAVGERDSHPERTFSRVHVPQLKYFGTTPESGFEDAQVV
ncbi:MAG: hypothetical protein UW37_C0004G0002 [Candidatus Gottesmanbacteria bacterium GW2011_GWA2_44_17]|uniref:Uncharacterized protein n=3 Tax=Candidatus Gottesmaniibacteriota TaxID=1752720 RepID=A0A0G1IQK7_9BACT|nr:MAG: hypothetical protein UV63_C0046G0007 [Microgenomates group bacterium GW2011_GWC1_43_11]KKT34598.1 MAG: hypothetical protein UW22_C0070G0006 [Candidatus Gottesmanbacteria bacterium GW2011_GWB1_44_11c]KKT47711.1 MAG: hypothetical protein UW37_C0004G0002 [Candidatus Gottesmanbacteria bacterium GW2011_GWA2_44_17]KKT61440.1 MAG: hypothetical protein UW52_C0003G0003 [Candidatus Gottesmanbacteria bacterium GW2011_GWA1_44_24b]HCM82717.1 hypothetical protein [Patescibacteria group bacterium]